LARRRLFGWKVRLLTVWLHHNLRTWCTATARALGWVDNAPSGNPVGALVEQHRRRATELRGIAAAHENSTVRINPYRGQTEGPAPPVRSQAFADNRLAQEI
jgi:hypothetical protein